MIAVIFEAKAKPEQQQRYFQLSAELKPLLSDIDGFISVERFTSLADPEKFLSLSWWRDAESIRQWKTNMQHQSAQTEGYQSIFSFYQIQVAEVIKDDSSNTKGKHNV
ncbi:antibiotic biosynthesis monooxygenase family protein [Agarivorans sp. QJM3NY_33]|uniref:antibiotic biosynthesis monooxygenase family protein n=1 Tax=Agarivorans sp. QJM3NY_33 TaxID=3421432 RepID=UPI003D7C8FE5